MSLTIATPDLDPTTATSLDELLGILRMMAVSDSDLSSLPTFGGEEIRDTEQVWSWDATRVLVGTHAGDYRIVSRAEWAERA